MRNIEEVFADRTCYKFLDRPVSKVLLEEIYNGFSEPLDIEFFMSLFKSLDKSFNILPLYLSVGLGERLYSLPIL